MNRPECPQGLIAIDMPDMPYSDVYWQILAFCTRPIYDEDEPQVVYIYSHGTTWGRLPVDALPSDFVETVQAQAEEHYRDMARPWQPETREEYEDAYTYAEEGING